MHQWVGKQSDCTFCCVYIWIYEFSNKSSWFFFWNIVHGWNPSLIAQIFFGNSCLISFRSSPFSLSRSGVCVSLFSVFVFFSPSLIAALSSWYFCTSWRMIVNSESLILLSASAFDSSSATEFSLARAVYFLVFRDFPFESFTHYSEPSRQQTENSRNASKRRACNNSKNRQGCFKGCWRQPSRKRTKADNWDVCEGMCSFVFFATCL